MNKLERILSNFVGFRSKKVWKQSIACMFYIFAISLCFAGFYGFLSCLLLVCGINFIVQLFQILFSHQKTYCRRLSIFAALTALSTAGLFLCPAPARPLIPAAAPSPSVQNMTPSPAPTAVSSPLSSSPMQEQERFVYITVSGKKYHNPGCPSLAHSASPMTLKDALLKGYTPCKRCNP